MKFYVAARYEVDKDKALLIMGLLREKGHTVTADWTSDEQLKPYENNPTRSRDAAARYIEGVINADRVILLAPRDGGKGAYVEYGAAIVSKLLRGTPRDIYVVGPSDNLSVFYFHPAVTRVGDVAQLLRKLELV